MARRARGKCAMLKGDASNRRFWRVALDAPPRPGGASSGAHPASAIAIDLGPDDLPAYVRTLNLISRPPDEPPFLNVQRFLKSIGSAVPEIYAADLKRRMLLVEDVGGPRCSRPRLRKWRSRRRFIAAPWTSFC